MNVKTMLIAATVLMAAAGATFAQSSQGGPSVRDILNRAQTQSDKKAVEDLIGKLRTNAPTPAAPAIVPVQPTPLAPAAAAPQAQPTQSDRAAASVPQPAPTAPLAPAVPAAPASAAVAEPAPAAAPVAQPPQPPVAAAPAASASPQPAEPIGGASAGVTIGPAPAAPAARPDQQPAPQAPVTATPVSAPVGNARATSAAPSANDTAVVGAPIGPANALPTPIGPSEAEMARAPDIAREMGLPTVDIEVLFAYDSSEIAPAAAEGLMSLGRALQDPRLAGQKFVIAGHTDAKGAASYNLALSDRRAAAVRTFLVEHFKIAPDNLVARGFGESRLKNPRSPQGPENRRVQVINWSAQLVEQKRR